MVETLRTPFVDQVSINIALVEGRHHPLRGALLFNRPVPVPFDAILLDMAMPGMDGIETLKRMLEINADLQVILLTGQATLKQATDAMRLGAADFLEKPANLPELLSKIDEASAQTLLLMEKHTEEKLAKILGKKGW